MVRRFTFSLLVVWFISGISATAFGNHAMPVGENTVSPVGFDDFCRRHPGECAEKTRAPQPMRLTPHRRDDLRAVQKEVNQEIFYKSDAIHYGKVEFWEFPKWWGDCEDFALEKKRRLLALGWPRSALLLATVRIENKTPHLVLVAVTDQGEFVLDSRHQTVKEWRTLDYTWLRRQSRSNESIWVSLSPS